MTVTFRRDGLATDLVYQLQSTSDLTTWTTMAESRAGGMAVGQNGGRVVSEATMTGPFQLVTVEQTLPVGEGRRKFVRLKVERF